MPPWCSAPHRQLRTFDSPDAWLTTSRVRLVSWVRSMGRPCLKATMPKSAWVEGKKAVFCFCFDIFFERPLGATVCKHPAGRSCQRGLASGTVAQRMGTCGKVAHGVCLCSPARKHVGLPLQRVGLPVERERLSLHSRAVT